MAGEVKPFIARSRCRVGLVGVLGPIVQIVRSTVPRAGYQPSVGDTVAGQAVSDQHLRHAYEVIANLKYSERARIPPKFQATSCATATLRIYTTTSDISGATPEKHQTLQKGTSCRRSPLTYLRKTASFMIVSWTGARADLSGTPAGRPASPDRLVRTCTNPHR